MCAVCIYSIFDNNADFDYFDLKIFTSITNVNIYTCIYDTTSCNQNSVLMYHIRNPKDKRCAQIRMCQLLDLQCCCLQLSDEQLIKSHIYCIELLRSGWLSVADTPLDMTTAGRVYPLDYIYCTLTIRWGGAAPDDLFILFFRRFFSIFDLKQQI